MTHSYALLCFCLLYVVGGDVFFFVLFVFCVFFFLKEKDGIRDLVGSGGRGDVKKRGVVFVLGGIIVYPPILMIEGRVRVGPTGPP